jgi:hypothetical protein
MRWMWSIACTISLLLFLIVASIIGENNIWLLLLHSCIDSFAIGVVRGLMKTQHVVGTSKRFKTKVQCLGFVELSTKSFDKFMTFT